jgi:hypothetical protein
MAKKTLAMAETMVVMTWVHGTISQGQPHDQEGRRRGGCSGRLTPTIAIRMALMPRAMLLMMLPIVIARFRFEIG